MFFSGLKSLERRLHLALIGFYMCSHVLTLGFTHTHTHIYMYVYIYIYTYTIIYIYIYMHMYMYVCVCTNVYVFRGTSQSINRESGPQIQIRLVVSKCSWIPCADFWGLRGWGGWDVGTTQVDPGVPPPGLTAHFVDHFDDVYRLAFEDRATSDGQGAGETVPKRGSF